MSNTVSKSTKMTDLPHSEERYPLLFLFLDDGQKSSRKGRGVFFERSRSHGIMSGATTVFTQWPGQFNSCGLTIFVLFITTLLLFLILIASTIKPMTLHPLHPRCLRKNYDSLANTSLYVVHDADNWQQNQLDALEQIATKYNQCNIELVIFQNKQEHEISKTKANTSVTSRFRNLMNTPPYGVQALPRKKRQIIKDGSIHLLKDKPNDDIDLNINIGAKNQLKAFLERRRHTNLIKTSTPTTTTTTVPPILTVSDLVDKFPAIAVRNVTRADFFEESPLFSTWKNLNENVVIFAARILKLWENGGISFELPEAIPVPANLSEKQHSDQRNSSTTTIKAVPRTLSPIEENKIVKNMIDIGFSSFKTLPEGLVTVDEEGVHMETKTMCHAFFGEALQQLRAATIRTTVPEVIRNTLKIFCARNAVDYDYCNGIKA